MEWANLTFERTVIVRWLSIKLHCVLPHRVPNDARTVFRKKSDSIKFLNVILTKQIVSKDN